MLHEDLLRVGRRGPRFWGPSAGLEPATIGLEGLAHSIRSRWSFATDSVTMLWSQRLQKLPGW